jgi:hypothetical protein
MGLQRDIWTLVPKPKMAFGMRIFNPQTISLSLFLGVTVALPICLSIVLPAHLVIAIIGTQQAVRLSKDIRL